MHLNDVNKVAISAKQFVIKLLKRLNVRKKIVNVLLHCIDQVKTHLNKRVKLCVFIVFLIKKIQNKSMMAWAVFLVLLLIYISYLILRKFYNEYKIKIGRRNLAGKVVDIYFYLY